MAAVLASALDVVGGEPGDYTHGFHSYPARFPALLPRRLLSVEADAQRVLDPFVGSGTTLVEAALVGRRGYGVDINPLAVALTKLKASPLSPRRIARLLDAARAVAERSLAATRASRRRSSHVAGPPSDRTRFDDPRRYPPHVFRELVSLRATIDAIVGDADVDPDEPGGLVDAAANPSVADPASASTDDRAWLRQTLLLVLSSIVVKVSYQRSDTDETLVSRDVPRGAATRHFARKAEELVARMEAFRAALPPTTKAPYVRVADARRLDFIESRSIDLVITSPPYLGTYDYASHHARRFGWLGLDDSEMRRLEIGARRSVTGDEPAKTGASEGPAGKRDGKKVTAPRTATVETAEAAAFSQWGKDVHAYLREIARVLGHGKRAYLLVGDSTVGKHTVAGHLEVLRAAGVVGLEVLARASQSRPDVHPAEAGGEAGDDAAATAVPAPATPSRKYEHLIALQKP